MSLKLRSFGRPLIELEKQKEHKKGMKPKEQPWALNEAPGAPVPGSAAPDKYLSCLLSWDVRLVSPWTPYIPNSPPINFLLLKQM